MDPIRVTVKIVGSIHVSAKVKKAIVVTAALANTVVGAELAKTYNWPLPMGRQSSQRTGDDFWVEQNIFAGARVVGRTPKLDIDTYGEAKGWFWLKENNALGNKQRFTDVLGGTDYNGNGNYFIDHYTGLGWDNIPPGSKTSLNWNDIIDAALALTQAGFSDFFVPSFNQMQSICNYGTAYVFRWTNVPDVGYGLPLNNNSNSTFHCSTRNNNVTTQVQTFRRGGNVSTNIKSALGFTWYCRKHF